MQNKKNFFKWGKYIRSLSEISMKINENKLHSAFHLVTRALTKPHRINVYTNLFCKYAAYTRCCGFELKINISNFLKQICGKAMKIQVLLNLKSSWEMNWIWGRKGNFLITFGCLLLLLPLLILVKPCGISSLFTQLLSALSQQRLW